jgi:hypothetical protein
MANMIPIDGFEPVTQANLVLQGIFRNTDTFDEPFQPWILNRALLFSIPFELDRPSLHAIAQAAKDFGDDGIYFASTEYFTPAIPNCPQYWYIPLENIEEYYSLGKDCRFLSAEYALYSPKKTWGLLFSHEFHILAGGSPVFMEKLIELLAASGGDLARSLDEQAVDFLDTWKIYRTHSRADFSWVPRLLTHVYGSDKAEVILRRAGWYDNSAGES